jgi:hypothetical protein
MRTVALDSAFALTVTGGSMILFPIPSGRNITGQREASERGEGDIVPLIPASSIPPHHTGIPCSRKASMPLAHCTADAAELNVTNRHAPRAWAWRAPGGDKRLIRRADRRFKLTLQLGVVNQIAGRERGCQIINRLNRRLRMATSVLIR